MQRIGFAATMALTLGATAFAAPGGAAAQTYPDHVVQIVVPPSGEDESSS